MVMINHGSYRTIYANLKESYVKAGDKVAPNQLLGLVFTDPKDSRTELHLEIWQDFTDFNPLFITINGILGGMGAPEMIFILLIVLLLFGARKIPELARGLGKGIREF